MLNRFLHNIPGWHTKRHLVVFESDDWGSIRMPSLEVFNYLKAQKVPILESGGYDTCDTLASNNDLELLMDVLGSIKDSNGNPAKITLNCVMANPDFQSIKEDNFQNYHYELFTETLDHYPNHDRAFKLWIEGIHHNLFKPQFHGREHLNVLMWMTLLRNNVDYVRKAFDSGVFSMEVFSKDDPRRRVLDAFNILNQDESDYVCNSIREGLVLFERLFGYRSKSMIAPCYTWDEAMEKEAFNNGVVFIQGGFAQRPSLYAQTQGARFTHHYTGERNNNKQIYTIRNCFFEPTHHEWNNTDSCFKEIIDSFRLFKPAVVSCHRLNFIGELHPENRDHNLRSFKRLLKMITDKYPDVEFVSSDELGDIIMSSYDKKQKRL